MANIYVTEDSYLDDLEDSAAFVAGDVLAMNNYATLTVRKSNTVKPASIGYGYTPGHTIIDSTLAESVSPLILSFSGNSGTPIACENAETVTIKGSWYQLGTGDGNSGQTFNFYTTGYNLPWVQVETGNATDEWINFAGLCGSRTLSEVGAGEIFGSFFAFNNTTGVLTFGDGTNGMVVPSGARVRCPDILIVGTGTPLESSGLKISSAFVGRLDIDKVLFSDHCYLHPYWARESSIKNVGAFTYMSLDRATDTTLEDVVIAPSPTNKSIEACTIDTTSNISINRLKACSYQDNAIESVDSSSMTVTNSDLYVFNRASSTYDKCINMSDNTSPSFTNVNCIGSEIVFQRVSDINVSNMGHSDKFNSTTSTSIAAEAMEIINCSGSVDGFSKISGGAACYNEILNVDTCNNLLIVNVDYDGDNNSYSGLEVSNSSNCIFARMDFGKLRYRTLYLTFTNKDCKTFDILMEDTASYDGTILGKNCRYEGVAAVNASNVTWEGNYDIPVVLIYDPAATITTGYLEFWGDAEVNGSAWTFSDENAFFFTYDNALQCRNADVGDYFEIETPNWIYGVTSFKNLDAYIYQTFGTKLDITYALDTGGGYGSWKDATGSNLSGETVSATDGFKLKVRGTIAIATSFYMTSIKLYVNVDPTVKRDYLFCDIVLDNIITGSRYRIEKGSDGSLVAEGTASSTTQTINIPFNGNTPVTIKVRNASGATKYQPFTTGGTITSSGLSVYVAQVEDTIAV